MVSLHRVTPDMTRRCGGGGPRCLRLHLLQVAKKLAAKEVAEVNKRNNELEQRLAQAQAEAAAFKERIRAAEESVLVRRRSAA